ARSRSCMPGRSSRTARPRSSSNRWRRTPHSTMYSPITPVVRSREDRSVILSAPVAPRHAWVEQSLIARFARHSWAIAAVELDKLRRDPTEILTRAIQPALWLVVFGQVFTRTRAIPTGSLSYL